MNRAASPKATAPLSAEKCTICASLRRLLAKDDFTAYLGSDVKVLRNKDGFVIELGLVDETVTKPCRGHDQLLQFVCRDFKKSYGEENDKLALTLISTRLEHAMKPWHRQNHLVLHHAGDERCQIVIANERGTSRMWTMVLARERNEEESPGYGRVLDVNWVDLELIKGWKNDCLSKHGTGCSNPLRIRPVSPAWLVDTHTESLVPGAGISEYVALSYRWGSAASFRAMGNNLDTLLEPGSLSSDRFGSKMSPILLQAMRLVTAIDEHYLWVDTICIVQDDAVQRGEQLQLMGAIYASAKLVLVAADGDSSTGVLGFRGVSPPRQLEQNVIPIFDDAKVILRDPHNIPLDPPKRCLEYFDRGWTFQEFFLAKRRLIFACGQLHWTCAYSSWTEAIVPFNSGTSQKDVMDRPLWRILKGIPDFWALTGLIFDYMNRKHTFPEDALPGIAGLFAILSKSFKGGFLYGLPEMSFDSALMWRASAGWTKLRRRQNSGRSNLLSLSHPLPSWSWLGWEGKPGYFMAEQTFESWLRHNNVKPVAQWYTHETPNAVEKRPIKPTWHEVEDQLNGPILELPPGWTREPYGKSKDHQIGDNCARAFQEEHGQYIYRHELFPDEYFWIPIPVHKPDGFIDPWNPPQTPYISCETRRGWFSAVEIPASHFVGPESIYHRDYTFVAILLDHQGRWCGKLHLHDADEFSDFLKTNATGDAKVELVAICTMKTTKRIRATTSARAPGGVAEQDVDPLAYKDAYGVLWVEWVDGIAYRKASGFVSKDAWERHDLEDVHLVMG